MAGSKAQAAAFVGLAGYIGGRWSAPCCIPTLERGNDRIISRSPMKDLQAELSRIRGQDLYRSRRTLDSPQGPVARIDGRDYLTFCSNDYLGLAADPRLRSAFCRAADRYGVGSGAAHLVNGHSREHHALEEELAAFTGRPRALLFSTGYMANLGVVAALCGRGDTVLEDRLNHASLLDGGLLSGARLLRYGHNDPAALAARLDQARGETLVVTDGVFSMDGDLAPLTELAEVARRRDAWLMVDDAHGLGVLGRQGGGCLEYLGLDSARVPILVGTLGKALGTGGAFVAGSEDLIEYLIQKARTYIFTTAAPPALAAATRASLKIARQESWRRERLAALVGRFRAGAAQLGLELMDSATPIQPLVVGEAGRAVALSRTLEARGILVTAIRPPTVPPGTARLRFTFSAAHSEQQVDRLLEVLAAVVAKQG